MNPAKIEKVSLTWKLDASLTVTADGKDNWVKPGAAASITFDGLPTEEQVEIASEHMIKNIIEPQIETIISSAFAQIDKQTATMIHITGVGEVNT